VHEDESGLRPDRLIEWTGERCVPWTGDLQVIYEHYHRYLLARPLVDGRRVLDLASGEGYGSALLAGSASHVVGLEIDPASVEHSRRTYARDGLEFVEGSMLDLSAFPEAAFDVITCFEALEHVSEHDELMVEVRRVLSPDGIFLTSTPDRLRYTEELHQHNPHHVRELSRAEFVELLSGTFENVRVWGQAVAVGSLIQGVEGSPGGPAEVVALQQVGAEWVQPDAYPPTYFLAAASSEELPEMPQQSVLVDVDIALVREVQRELAERSGQLDAAKSEAAAWKSEYASVTAEQERLASHLSVMNEGAIKAREQLAVLESSLADAEHDLEAARDRVAELTACEVELSAIRNSALYRFGRAVRRPLRRPRQ
jgi:SAM-dependent methyltransferase